MPMRCNNGQRKGAITTGLQWQWCNNAGNPWIGCSYRSDFFFPAFLPFSLPAEILTSNFSIKFPSTGKIRKTYKNRDTVHQPVSKTMLSVCILARLWRLIQGSTSFQFSKRTRISWFWYHFYSTFTEIVELDFCFLHLKPTIRHNNVSDWVG